MPRKEPEKESEQDPKNYQECLNEIAGIDLQEYPPEEEQYLEKMEGNGALQPIYLGECHQEQIGKLQELVDKEKPMPVRLGDEPDGYHWHCPKCGQAVFYGEKHCADCGQSLSWDAVDSEEAKKEGY